MCNKCSFKVTLSTDVFVYRVINSAKFFSFVIKQTARLFMKLLAGVSKQHHHIQAFGYF